MESTRNISIQRVKNRPNSYIYKLSLPSFVIDVLKIDEDNRQVKIYEDGNKIKVRAREELAVAFQHEIDHLNGILFYDRIDKNKPFYNEGEIRLI